MALAAFQVSCSHTWLVATELDSMDLEPYNVGTRTSFNQHLTVEMGKWQQREIWVAFQSPWVNAVIFCGVFPSQQKACMVGVEAE